MKTVKRATLNSKGFSHLEMLLVAIVVIAVLGVGVLVYRHDKNSNVANAAGWTSLVNAYGVKISACKIHSDAYGGVNKVTFLFTKSVSTPAYTYTVSDWQRGKKISLQSSNDYWDKVAGELTVGQSIWYGDSVDASINGGSHGSTGWGWQPSAVKNWVNC